MSTVHSRKHRLFSVLLAFVMQFTLLNVGNIAYADELHIHTDACYGQATGYNCGLEESNGHWHGNDCYCAGGELKCGQEEVESHAHDDACYTDGNLTCALIETEGHAHDWSCYCYGGEVICGIAEGSGHTHNAVCRDQSKVLICGFGSSASQEGKPDPVLDYSYIQDLIANDANISYDPETQSIILLDIFTQQSKSLEKLNIENMAEYLKNYDQFFIQVDLNGNPIENGHPYYYVDTASQTIEYREANLKELDSYGWKGIALETKDNTNGVIALIVNKDDEYRAYVPTPKWYYTGYCPHDDCPYQGNGLALNPLSVQDAFGYSGKASNPLNAARFNYEWFISNKIIGDISVCNPEMKEIGNAGYVDIDNVVTLRVELRDSDGNIFLMPKSGFHVYSYWDFMHYMDEDGVLNVKTTSDDDGENKYGRFDFLIPIGYDYRITVLDNGPGLKDYGFSYNLNQEYKYDNDGFAIVPKDLFGDNWGTDDELVFMPKNKPIRIEKIIEGDAVNKEELYVFQAVEYVPTYSEGEYIRNKGFDMIRQPDKKNILSNYHYKLFDSETDEELKADEELKTDIDGYFQLAAGQYALFYVWEAPADFREYENGSALFCDIVDTDVDVPTETYYSFEEISKGDYSTILIHVHNQQENKVDGSLVNDVVAEDSIIFNNRFGMPDDPTDPDPADPESDDPEPDDPTIPSDPSQPEKPTGSEDPVQPKTLSKLKQATKPEDSIPQTDDGISVSALMILSLCSVAGFMGAIATGRMRRLEHREKYFADCY